MTASDSTVCHHEPGCAQSDARPEHNLIELIEHAAHLLPAQGPITAFVHHNTLHAFEELPFDTAVRRGAEVFDCEPYWPESKYRSFVKSERIQAPDLRAVLIDDLDDRAGETIGTLTSRYQLRLAMLQSPLESAKGHELHWLLAETDALKHFRDDTPAGVRQRIVDCTRQWVMRDFSAPLAATHTNRDSKAGLLSELVDRFGTPTESWSEPTWESFSLQALWRVCVDGIGNTSRKTSSDKRPVRHRDILLQATGEDSDVPVHDLLVRLCAAFLDQGMADWSMPRRQEGFFQAFVSTYARPAGPLDRWLRGLHKELERITAAGSTPVESIEESLQLLGVGPGETERFVTDTLLALRGWAGMIWQLETRGDRVAHPAPSGSLVEFLAVRLILERLALAHVAREKSGFRGDLSELRDTFAAQISQQPETPNSEELAFLVFQTAQTLGWSPQELHKLPKEEWSQLVGEIEEFNALERRRIFHAAYERHFNVQLLDAVGAHAARVRPRKQPPAFQICFCIDDREESFRRHLEEVAPDCETFGYAGFYGVAMYYRGAAEAHYLPLCPVIIKPEHYVREEVPYTFGAVHRRRSETRRALGTASHRWHVESRTFLGGILTALFGALASVPMVARILFPRLTARIRERFGSFIQPPPITQLKLERQDAKPGPEESQIGFTVAEMATIVERGLRDMGLTSNFARLVIITGHGSSSVNNPHESAYNCGACAGGRGGPNARAFAQMANDPRIRHALAEQGLPIPWTTVFIGAYHDTCNDRMTYFDLDRLPSSHWNEFEHVKDCIDETRERNAHERCRRFVSAGLTLTPEQALWHVESRAENLSEARPEYNHATNAVTIVGRRWRTRGLFLDRRAFLASYDPESDDEHYTLLTRVLQAVIPVCAGISLEYYFSCVDPEGWGCGSKLPHNLASLLGVMSGAASDLRPGLSQQMIEIHEPMRQVFVIETVPAAMLRIMESDAGIRNLVSNEWVHLAVLDPHSSELQVFRDGEFEPYQPENDQLPVMATSAEWYRGWRGHLRFATVDPAMHEPGNNDPATSQSLVATEGVTNHAS